MIPAERHDIIMNLLLERKYVSLNEISAQTSIPKSTLRRDIFDLEQNGLLIRTRGGVSLNGDMEQFNVTNEASVHVRKSENRDEKIRIAKAAMQFIHPNDTLFLDSGTTTYELAVALKEYNYQLMVACNDLAASLELSNNEQIELIVIGGKLRKHNYSMIGYFSENIISQMHADTSFISTDAVDPQKGLMAFSLDEVTGKKAMIKGAREVILLCDHTKFSHIAFVTISNFEEIDRIITGKELDESTCHYLTELGIDVILV